MLKYTRTAKIFNKGGGIGNRHREQMTSNRVIVSSLFFLVLYFEIQLPFLTFINSLYSPYFPFPFHPFPLAAHFFTRNRVCSWFSSNKPVRTSHTTLRILAYNYNTHLHSSLIHWMDLRDSDSGVLSSKHYRVRNVPTRVYMFRNGDK